MIADSERREVAERLRKAIGLTEFAEVLGFNWTDDSDWVWNDVSNLVADLIEPSCDREELLALADEMEQKADENRLTGMMSIVRARSWADRIREACGEAGR